jgi:gamma-glutamyltranspeptidase/glutathione hydrolase
MRVILGLVCALVLAPATYSAPDLGVASRDGLVVCTSSPACDAGASVLARGGNAVDGAVATAFALAVTHPSAGNIGGGGFMMIRSTSGDIVGVDYREKAPLKSTRTMYLNPDGTSAWSSSGYMAPGVPGTVRGLELAHKRFGKLPWKDVVMPAVELAEKGFAVSSGLARGLNAQISGPMAKFPSSVAAYGKPGGGPWAEGDRIVLADLGRTLRAIATDGADVFYKGWVADRIAADMKANGGIITKDDLGAYQAKVRTPVKGTFHGYEVTVMAPPSSGGVAMLEMLNLLEPFDLKAKGAGSAEAIHLEAEAMRRAFLDRARYLGDPDFTDVPVAKLISKEYAKTIPAIDPAKATSSVELGRDIVTKTTQEPDETTHFSVMDKDGMVVSSTYTLEGGYGSSVVVAGAGFILNNEMGDFNKRPGETSARGDIGTAPNLIDPGKRMLSSMTPTIVTKDGKVVLVTGSPGGRTIINTVTGVVLGVTEYGMTGREAVDMPRFHHQWLPDRLDLERTGFTDEVIAKLKAMGHDVRVVGTQGDAHTIWIAPDGTPYGVNDKRSADSKASVPMKLTAPTAGR